MAKVAAKTPASTPAKTPKKTSAAKTPAQGSSIEKVSQETLEKLKTLGIDQQLQNDLEWCLGSYRSDNNPVGLYEMAERALAILREEKILL